jgi:hypothetical protein
LYECFDALVLELVWIVSAGKMLITGVCNFVVPAFDALDKPDVDELREASVDFTS